MEPNATYR